MLARLAHQLTQCYVTSNVLAQYASCATVLLPCMGDAATFLPTVPTFCKVRICVAARVVSRLRHGSVLCGQRSNTLTSTGRSLHGLVLRHFLAMTLRLLGRARKFFFCVTFCMSIDCESLHVHSFLRHFCSMTWSVLGRARTVLP